MHSLRPDLKNLWRRTLARCDGKALVESGFVDLVAGDDVVHVISLGKAAGAMAAGAVSLLGPRAVNVIVAAPGRDGVPTGASLYLGEHPYPGTGSFAAGRAILDAARDIRRSGGRALVLVSGGASALVDMPAPGLLEEDVVLAHRALVESGAPIEAVNRIRGRLSAFKSGGLAQALGPSLKWEGVLVDVPSGDPDAVGSGPCNGAITSDRRVLATPSTLLEAASQMARESGDTRLLARHAVVSGATVEDLGLEILDHLARGGGFFIATGEVSVPLPRSGVTGRGGRAQHLAAWVLNEARQRVPGGRRWSLLAAGSDGRDGAGGAGALIDETVPYEKQALGVALESFDTGELHRAIGTLLEEHPPRTNLTDLYVAWSE